MRCSRERTLIYPAGGIAADGALHDLIGVDTRIVHGETGPCSLVRRSRLGKPVEEFLILRRDLHLDAVVANILIDVFPVISHALIRELDSQSDQPSAPAALTVAYIPNPGEASLPCPLVAVAHKLLQPLVIGRNRTLEDGPQRVDVAVQVPLPVGVFSPFHAWIFPAFPIGPELRLDVETNQLS